MIILKLILKIALLPVLLLTILGQWIGTFFTGIASVILGLLSGLCWIVAILGYLMGICTGHETMQILIMAFVAFVIPECCGWLIEKIVLFRCFLGEIMRS